jgi:glycosyltransferase involved in cell wall biosynthesis
MERKPAVAVVFHHIGPYHHARLNAAGDELSITAIEWSAESCDAWGIANTPARYQKVSLFAKASHGSAEASQLRSAFRAALEQTNPDVVAVNGWNNFGSLIAANCCLDREIPMIVMSESSRQDQSRNRWKESIKRRIVAFYSAALVGGQRHVDYLIELGMPSERMFTGYDVVDNAYFGDTSKAIRRDGSKIRKEYGLPQNYFLACARFVEKKNLPRLIRAYAEYRRKSRSVANLPWDLVLLGDGPLRETLHAHVSSLNLDEHVHLPGFKSYDDLPVYYGLARAFVHASAIEQWGLVVNEAVASGLPVIVSNHCGCVPELVNCNGFTFDPTNEPELTDRLFEMASLSDQERKELGDKSERIAAKFPVAGFGEGLASATRVAMEVPRKRFGPVDRALLLAAGSYAR